MNPEIEIELVSEYKTDFVKQFKDKTKGMTKKEVAELVWDFGNSRWSAGYAQGKYNPDFDGEDDVN